NSQWFCPQTHVLRFASKKGALKLEKPFGSEQFRTIALQKFFTVFVKSGISIDFSYSVYFLNIE
ncbi:MAG: hypothetical protein MK165_17410, partial [Pirellulaceae bacterium]|nr:hypothetical protein [Pirellulaceae bacterium]